MFSKIFKHEEDASKLSDGTQTWVKELYEPPSAHLCGFIDLTNSEVSNHIIRLINELDESETEISNESQILLEVLREHFSLLSVFEDTFSAEQFAALEIPKYPLTQKHTSDVSSRFIFAEKQ